MIKAHNKLQTCGNFLNLVKDIYKEPPANIIFNGESVDAFSLKSEIRQHCTRGSSQGNSAINKKNKNYPYWIGGNKITYIHRTHTLLNRRLQGIHEKTIRTKTNLAGLQDKNQYMKIFMQLQYKIWK